MRNYCSGARFLIAAPFMTLIVVVAGMSEYNVVVTAMHRYAGEPFMPDCSRYDDQAHRAIQGAFDHYYDDRRRNLRQPLEDIQANSESTESESDRDDTTDCAELCNSVVDGWCFWATGGVCSSPSRRLHRVNGTQLISTLCGQRPRLVQEALENLGNEIDSNHPCSTYFEGPWDTDCFAIE